MTHSLDIQAGDTYRVDSGTKETHANLSNLEGELVTAGHLVLSGEDARAVQPPTGIDLPMGIKFRDMNMGIAVFLIGTLATTLSVGYAARNYAALIMWGLAVIALLLGGIMGMGLEIFWMSLIGVVVLLMVGFIVRWAA